MSDPRANGRRLHPFRHLQDGDADSLLTGRLLTVAELCRLLGMSRRWVHERTRRGEIPCYRFGTALRFDLEEIRRWIVNFHAAHSNREGAETWGS